MKWEKLAQSPLEILLKNNAQTPKFIGLEKLAVGGLSGLSVDRPVDRPTVIFQTVVPSVDRSRIQRAQLSVRPTGRSTGAFPESRALRTVDRVGRPASSQNLACTSVHVGRPPGRLTSSSVDRSGRPAEARTGLLQGLKTWYFDTNKIP